MDARIGEAKAGLERARNRQRASDDLKGFPLEALLDVEDWHAIWQLLEELEQREPALTSTFGDEDEAASALIDHLDRFGPSDLAGLARSLREEHEDSPAWLVTVELANALPSNAFIDLGDHLAIVATFDLADHGHAKSHDAEQLLSKHFGDLPARGSRRDRDDDTGALVDKRTYCALVSVEHGPRGRAILRAEVRARYALAVWCLLSPPGSGMTDGTMWPAVARWAPSPHVREIPQTKPWRPGAGHSHERRATGASYDYPPWALPDRRTLLLAVDALARAEAGSHFAGALLSAARSLYLAADPVTDLTAMERLVHVQVAQEVLAEKPPGGKRSRSFDTACDRLNIWDPVTRAFGNRAVTHARDRLRRWRALAVHRPHAFRAHLGFPPDQVLTSQQGRMRGSDFSPALARRDLAILYEATRMVAKALWQIADRADFRDATLDEYFAD